MKKILLTVLSVVLVAALAIGGTLAYLTTTPTTLSNVVTVGDIDIKLDEKVDVIGSGSVVENGNGATYSGVMPGDKLQKEVTVENTGTKPAYVRVDVNLNNVNEINKAIDVFYEAIYGENDPKVQAIYDYIFDGWGIRYTKVDDEGNGLGMRLTITGDDMPEYVMQVDSVKTIDEYTNAYNGNWNENNSVIISGDKFPGYYSKDMNKYELHYAYYLYLEAGETATLFEGLNVPAEFNKEQLAMFDNLKIDVTASAIQADNIPSFEKIGSEAHAKVAFAVLAGEEIDLTLDEWDGTVDTSWYDASATEYVLDSAEDLAGLAELVNAGTTFSKKTVKLATNVDLDNKEWTPIGNATNKFQGTFDGDGNTVKNLKITGNNDYVGLFGYTINGEIKNVNIYNAYVSGRVGVGALSGCPYTSKYTNITLKGNVQINGLSYVGGVIGRNAYANVTDVTVDVNEGSYVNANSVENGQAYRTYVGGVIGFAGEGSHTFTNITSNIDVIGTNCDVGGIIGIAHYNNSFINCSSTGNVTITSAEDAGDAEQIGGIAGVWMNSTGKVTFFKCSFTGNLSVNVAGVDLTDNTIVGAAYGSGNGELVVSKNVSTADELVAALEAGKDVILTADVKIDPANMSNAYGATGINVKNGQTIDGNGNTLDIKGANGTWDSGINTTGGIIKNITVTGSFRGIFINHNSDHSERVVLENVIIDGTTYTISCDQGENQGLTATDCTFNGWTSYAATLGDATFINCSFGEGNGYAYMRPYAPTTFVGCDFEAGYEMDARAAVTFEDCTIGGVPLTADNLATLVTSNIANATVVD